MQSFDEKTYWENRLSKNFDISTSGYRPLGLDYNRWLYRLKANKVKKVVTKYGTEIENANILDIGSGTGFYIEFWSNLGAKKVTGLDITNISVHNLQKKFPEYNFHRLNIADPSIENKIDKKFSIIGAFDVLYHIVDDNQFYNAISNIKRLSDENCLLFITDTFRHQSVKRSNYLVSRTLKTYLKILEKNDFTVVERIPVFFLMNPPDEISNRCLKWLFDFIWRYLFQLIQRHGNVTGRILYFIDTVLTYLFRESPTVELMVCKYSA